jgi:hypothetical protein
LVIRASSDLPEAARRIKAMLHARGRQVALRDITVVAATLIHDVPHAADLLQAEGH